MNILHNSKGFAALEVALVVIVMGIVGGSGYYVYDSQKETKKLLDSTSANNEAASKAATQNKLKEDDPTANWKPYSNEAGKFSAKFPSNWETAANPEYCSEGLLLVGVKMSDGTSSVGKCGSGGAGAFGQMAITWSKERADMANCGYNDAAWKVNAAESVKVSNQQAVKTNATYIEDDTEFGGYEKGTKSSQYCFVGNNMLYIASYTQRADYPDVLSDFETMMTKTFTLR